MPGGESSRVSRALPRPCASSSGAVWKWNAMSADNVTPTGWPPRWSAPCGSPRYDEFLARIADAKTPDELLDLIDAARDWLTAATGHNLTASKQAAAAVAIASRKFNEMTAPQARGR
jgi:hypothetical protein